MFVFCFLFGCTWTCTCETCHDLHIMTMHHSSIFFFSFFSFEVIVIEIVKCFFLWLKMHSIFSIHFLTSQAKFIRSFEVCTSAFIRKVA